MRPEIREVRRSLERDVDGLRPHGDSDSGSIEGRWIGLLDQRHQRAKCVAVDMLPLSQEPGKEGGGTASYGANAIDSFTPDFLRSLAFVLRICWRSVTVRPRPICRS